MPRSPFTFSGVLKDTDGSTNFQGAKVRVYNAGANAGGVIRTVSEAVDMSVTASDGSFSVDISDPRFTTDYAYNDIIFIGFRSSDNKKSSWVRYKITAADGGVVDLGSVILHDTDAFVGPAKIFSGSIGGATTAGDFAEFRDPLTDAVIIPRLVVIANTTVPFNYGYIGSLPFTGGIAVIRSNDTANRIQVHIVAK